jgi:hypothetical protein
VDPISKAIPQMRVVQYIANRTANLREVKVNALGFKLFEDFGQHAHAGDVEIIDP